MESEGIGRWAVGISSISASPTTLSMLASQMPVAFSICIFKYFGVSFATRRIFYGNALL